MRSTRLGCYLEDLSSPGEPPRREQRRERHALRPKASSPRPSNEAMGRPWCRTPDMVKTGDIVNTLRLATQAEVERADLPSRVGTDTATSVS